MLCRCSGESLQVKVCFERADLHQRRGIQTMMEKTRKDKILQKADCRGRMSSYLGIQLFCSTKCKLKYSIIEINQLNILELDDLPDEKVNTRLIDYYVTATKGWF